jgi:predicted secreted acid phosphatase
LKNNLEEKDLSLKLKVSSAKESRQQSLVEGTSQAIWIHLGTGLKDFANWRDLTPRPFPIRCQGSNDNLSPDDFAR